MESGTEDLTFLLFWTSCVFRRRRRHTYRKLRGWTLWWTLWLTRWAGAGLQRFTRCYLVSLFEADQHTPAQVWSPSHWVTANYYVWLAWTCDCMRFGDLMGWRHAQWWEWGATVFSPRLKLSKWLLLFQCLSAWTSAPTNVLMMRLWC